MEQVITRCAQADGSGAAPARTELTAKTTQTERQERSEEPAAHASLCATQAQTILLDVALPHTHPNARHIRAARLASVARAKGGSARALRGADLRQARVLMQALCEMRLELRSADPASLAATLDTRHTTTMALWRNRDRAVFLQPEIERGIEERLHAGFRHARSGSTQEAANEFKRAYFLLCCALTHARDMARRDAAAASDAAADPKADACE